MASSTETTSSGSFLEEMDQRKKRRMISNRESARRSRMRKQKHLDELVTQLSQLRKENNELMSNISITTQHYLGVEAENSVLTAQAAELSHRLQSLNEIIAFMRLPNDVGGGFAGEQHGGGGGGAEFGDEFMFNSLSQASHLYACQPILASADMIMY